MQTYPTRFLRLVASGTMFGGPEQYAWGLNLMPVGSASARPTTVPDAVRTAVEAFHSNAVGPGAKMTMLKLNEIGTDGLYTQPQTVLHEYGTPFGATTGTNYPPQIAAVVSLATSARRGLAARGRFYVPCPNVAIDLATGCMTAAAQGTLQTTATTLLQALNAALDGWRVAVVAHDSPKDPNGAAREVRHVRVGRVLDTIRSRRSSIEEQYVDGNPVTGYSDLYVEGLGGTSGSF